ncbi:hypothetical protein EVAR_47222_1, partial [Eumeta japonica]
MNYGLIMCGITKFCDDPMSSCAMCQQLRRRGMFYSESKDGKRKLGRKSSDTKVFRNDKWKDAILSPQRV